jgi:putative transcriptional regulator
MVRTSVPTMNRLLSTTVRCTLLALLADAAHAFHVSSQSPRSTTQLSSLRNSDRAFYERSLEEMMDNDWRVFRAKLVAQEQQQEDPPKFEHHVRPHRRHQLDEALQRQGQLGELFAGAISGIFTNHKQQYPPSKFQSSRYDRSIFDGDSVGGVSSPEPSYEQHLHFASATGNGPQSMDPFVSLDELPVHMPLSTPVTINKHRWAHPISHLEPGCVLLANEKLGGVFHQTVVLIIEHHEHAGTLGIVINRYVSCDFIYFASRAESDFALLP